MNNQALKILKRAEAIIQDGHFVGVSGLHLDTYVNKDSLFPHSKLASKIGRLFAEKNKSKKVEVVVAPALGGIILSQWTSFHLSNILSREVLGTYTEKTKDNDQIFTRGYEKFVKGKRVLIIEDTTTTGGSVMKTFKAVKKAKGKVVGISVMVNTNPKEVNSKKFGVPFNALIELEVKKFKPADCLMCKQKIAVNTKVGHGKKFLESKFGK